MPDIYYVDGQNGSASNGATSPSDAVAKVSEAITAGATDGDTIQIVHTHTTTVTITETATITLTDRMKLKGPGPSLLTITNATAGSVLTMVGYGMEIEGITIDSGVATDNITGSAVDGMTVRNCRFTQSADGWGIRATGSNFVIENCWFDGLGFGGFLSVTAGSGGHTFSNCRFTDCVDAVDIRDGFPRTTVQDCSFWDCTNGVQTDADDTVIRRCTFINSVTADIDIVSNADSTIIEDCTYTTLVNNGTNTQVYGRVRTSQGHPLDVVSLQHSRGR